MKAVRIPLDRPIGRLYYLNPSLLFFEQAGISCRVAEGRALGRHGNRIGIIYLHRRCQLSPGNGDHEIRVSEIDSHFPSLFSHLEKGFCVNWGFYPARPAVTERSCTYGDEHVRTPLPRMRQDLGQPAAQHLRKLFLAARNHLRLRFSPTAHFARPVGLACAEHVALSRTAAATGGVPALPPSWVHPASFGAAIGRKDRIAPALC